jgi:hypothetical protein
MTFIITTCCNSKFKWSNLSVWNFGDKEEGFIGLKLDFVREENLILDSYLSHC